MLESIAVSAFCVLSLVVFVGVFVMALEALTD